jgi:hypothetical protein
MCGFITERNLAEADEAFPGIRAFFDSLVRKPSTFLELVGMFEHWCDPAGVAAESEESEAARWRDAA